MTATATATTIRSVKPETLAEKADVWLLPCDVDGSPSEGIQLVAGLIASLEHEFAKGNFDGDEETDVFLLRRTVGYVYDSAPEHLTVDPLVTLRTLGSIPALLRFQREEEGDRDVLDVDDPYAPEDCVLAVLDRLAFEWYDAANVREVLR